METFTQKRAVIMNRIIGGRIIKKYIQTVTSETTI